MNVTSAARVTRDRSKRGSGRLPVLLCSAIVVGVMLPVAILVAPWLRVSPIPLQLALDAPRETKVKVCWDRERQECLPLLPHAKPAEKMASMWLGELPPRSVYRLSIVFEGPVEAIVFRKLTLLNVRNVDVPLYQWSSDDAPPWFSTVKVKAQRTNAGMHLTSEAAGRLEIEPTVMASPESRWPIALLLWVVLSAVALIAMAFLVGLLFPRDEVPVGPAHSVASAKPIWVAFVLGAAIHVFLVFNSRVVLAGGDSLIYLLHANSLVENGTYASGAWFEYELSRLPGYPAILASIMKLFGYHLSTITLIQGLLFSASVLALALSLRRWIHPTLGAMAVFIALISPAQVWASRAVLSESVFGSCAIFAMAAFFMHVRTDGRRSKAWLGTFAVLAAYTFFIRPNGICLYAAIIPVYLPRLSAVLFAEGSLRRKARQVLLISIPYVLVLLVFVGSVAAWSTRNYLKYNFVGFSDMTGVTLIAGLIVSGTFDVTSLHTNLTNLYHEYLSHKHERGQYYPGFALRHDRFIQLTHNGTRVNNGTLAQLDADLRELAASSRKRSPWQVSAAGLLRSGWWALRWPDVEAFSKEGIRLDYASFKNCGNRPGGACPETAQMIEPFLSSISKDLVYDNRRESLFYSWFSVIATVYYKWYIGLSLAALVSALCVAWRGHRALTALGVVFIANIAINVYLLNVFSRYIHILDVFLVFQCVLGVSLLLDRGDRAREWMGARPHSRGRASTESAAGRECESRLVGMIVEDAEPPFGGGPPPCQP